MNLFKLGSSKQCQLLLGALMNQRSRVLLNVNTFHIIVEIDILRINSRFYRKESQTHKHEQCLGTCRYIFVMSKTDEMYQTCQITKL